MTRLLAMAACFLFMFTEPAYAEPISLTAILVSSAIALASSVALALIAGRPDTPDRDRQDFDLASLPRVDEGVPVPIVYGQTRLTGLTVLGHGGESTRTVWKRVDGGFFASDKHVAVAYDYYLDIAFGACLGPIDSLHRIWIDNTVAVNGFYEITGSTAAINVNIPAFFGGAQQGGGVGGVIRVAKGTAGQPVDAAMEGYLGAGNVPRFAHQCNLVFTDNGSPDTDGRGFYWGERAFLPSLSIEARRLPNPLGLSLDGIYKSGNRHADANPANVLYDLLTNRIYGGKLQARDIDIASFRRAGERLIDERHGYSTAFIRAQTTRDMVRDITTQIGAIMFQSRFGKTKLRLIRPDYYTRSLPVITGADIVEGRKPVNTRRNTDSTTNQVKITFPDWTRGYADATAVEQDDAAIEDSGFIDTHEIRMRGISTLNLASIVATRVLKELKTPLLAARLPLVGDSLPDDVEPGDLFVYSYEPDGITGAVMRISSVSDGATGDNTTDVVAVQDQFSTGEALFDPPDESVAPPHEEVKPLADLDVAELPYWLARWHIGARTTAGSDPAEPYLFYAGARDATDLASTGFRPEITRPGAARVSDDVDCRFNFGGTVQSTVLASATEMVVADLVGTDLVTGALFPENTADDLRNGRRLVMAGGGPHGEIFGYRNAVSLGGGAWRLTGLERGMVDTQPQNMAGGTRVWFLGTEIPNNFGVLTFRIGDSLQMQARTFSPFGELEPPQELPEFRITGRSSRPLSPRIDGNWRQAVSVDGSTPRFVIPLRYRNRSARVLSLSGDYARQEPEAGYIATWIITGSGTSLVTTRLVDNRERYGGHTLEVSGFGPVSGHIHAVDEAGYSFDRVDFSITLARS